MTLPSINQALPTGVPLTDLELSKDHQNIHIVINPEVLQRLKKEELSINQLFILLSMYHEKIVLLDIYDSKSTKKQILLLEYQDLLIHGFFAQSDESSSLIYELTDKGKEFVEEISQFFELEEDEKMMDAKIKTLAVAYRELFPNIKLPSNVYGRVSILEIEKKLKAWFKVYRPAFKKEGIKVTEEDILNATKAYIARYVKDKYNYMMNSSYFIQKKEKSALADEIFAMKNGLGGPVINKFEKII